MKMNYLECVYITVVFIFITCMYMILQAGRISLDRRLSLGRAQVNKIIAENARRLSHFGLQVERRFSHSQGTNTLESRGAPSEVKRNFVQDTIAECVQHNGKQGAERPPFRSNTGTICEEELCNGEVKANSSDESTQVKLNIPVVIDEVDIEEEVESIPDEQTVNTLRKRLTKILSNPNIQINNSTSFPESRVSRRPSVITAASRISDGVRRDSILPVFNSPKSLPRRKSVMPVLMEDNVQGRRSSVSINNISPMSSLLESRKEVLLVKAPSYVCPRRSSVLFNSALFAHIPGRRPSRIDREDSIPETGNTSIANQSVNTESSLNAEHGGSSHCVWKKGFCKQRRMSNTGNIYRPRRGSLLPSSMERVNTDGNVGDDMSQSVVTDNGDTDQERRKSIPKLKGNYLTGNLTEFKKVFGPNAHEELTIKHQRYGPVYQINGLGQKVVFLFDYSDIDNIKKAEGKCPKHMDFKHLRIYRQRNNLPLGVLLSSGDDWKRQRNILSKAMNSRAVQQQYIPVINQAAKTVVEVINGKLSLDTFSEIYMPEKDVNNYSIEAFGRVLYGRNLNCLSSNKETDLHKFVEIAKSNFEDAKALMTLPSCLMLLHPAWRRHNEKWNFLLETTIKQSLLSIHFEGKTPCVLSDLLKQKEMTEAEMLVNLTDLLLASIDTTSTAIHWCLYELSKHPDSVTHIVEDYRQYVGEATEVTLEHVQNMTFLKSVIKETLRLHPVGFLAIRTISRQMCVREYKVPPQANVAVCMYVMGRNKQLLNDPDVFRPDRWTKNNQELDRFYKDVPFGFGARMCIGKRIAEIEIALFLLHFCLNFEFRLSPMCQLDHVVKLLLVPSGPLEIYIKARKD